MHLKNFRLHIGSHFVQGERSWLTRAAGGKMPRDYMHLNSSPVGF